MYPDNENTFYINITHYLNDVIGNVLSIYTDYYPHGSIMPGRHFTSSTQYRYDYQGIEKDQETNWNNFELRMYDANLGRWMSPDPYGEFFSPYLAMGNNPVSTVDPDGGKTARSGTGAGFEAEVYDGRTRPDDPFDMVGMGGAGVREEHYLKTPEGSLINLDGSGPYSVGEQLRGFGYYAAGTGSTAQATQISSYTFNVYTKGSNDVKGSFNLSFDRNGNIVNEGTPWMNVALSQYGIKELTNNNDGKDIEKYLATTGLDGGNAWCSAFANWTLLQSGIKGTNSALALSWIKWGQSLKKPAYGSLAIINYGEDKGHVGFVAGVNSNGKIILLGGNQKDMVKYSAFDKSSISRFVYPKGYQPNYYLPKLNISGNTNFRSTR